MSNRNGKQRELEEDGIELKGGKYREIREERWLEIVKIEREEEGSNGIRVEKLGHRQRRGRETRGKSFENDYE
ncbi:hypothetical protein ACLOJK_032943 [Asimina triloba]